MDNTDFFRLTIVHGPSLEMYSIMLNLYFDSKAILHGCPACPALGMPS